MVTPFLPFAITRIAPMEAFVQHRQADQNEAPRSKQRGILRRRTNNAACPHSSQHDSCAGTDQDITDRADILSKLREKPDDEIEHPFSFIHLGHGLTSDGGLHHGIHTRLLQPIARVSRST